MIPKEKNQIDLIKLEHVLITNLRPTFLVITFPDEHNTIQVIISCFKFDYLQVPERIKLIFDLINDKIPEIIQDRLIMFQAYSSGEMELVLGDVFS